MVVLGIDIGKREVFVNLQDSGGESAPQVLGHLRLIANTAAGFQQIEEWLKKRVGNIREVKVVMEATSVYWEQCAYFFHALSCSVSVVNPAQIKYFARSVLRRGKTDAMDAEIIARYGHVMHPTCWVPPRAVFSELRQLISNPFKTCIMKYAPATHRGSAPIPDGLTDFMREGEKPASSRLRRRSVGLTSSTFGSRPAQDQHHHATRVG